MTVDKEISNYLTTQTTVQSPLALVTTRFFSKVSQFSANCQNSFPGKSVFHVSSFLNVCQKHKNITLQHNTTKITNNYRVPRTKDYITVFLKKKKSLRFSENDAVKNNYVMDVTVHS